MRIEKDALGERQLQDSCYFGIQTLRANENFAISGKAIADIPYYVESIAQIKKAAAMANLQIGRLTQIQSKAICQTADEVITDKDNQAFPLDIYQGGGGTSTNMNVNEVLANRANEIITGHKGYDQVHPNTHVNMGQSTNDVIPSAMKLTVYCGIQLLKEELSSFTQVLHNKELEFSEVVKIGRTCLQDALPITLGQQFSGYRSAFERLEADLKPLHNQCLELPLGGTALGTGFGTYPGFKDFVYKALEEVTGLPVKAEENLIDGLQNADFWILVSATLKRIALTLNKLCSDLRIMSSGPRAGLNEIGLPAVQPGSSIMPGKVNPVMPEMAMQVYFRVLGNDLTISRACEGELDLNVWESLILNCITESMQLLSSCLPLLAEKCIQGIRANREKCRGDSEKSLALSTVVAKLFDYTTASRVAREADAQGKTIRETVVEMQLMTSEEADHYLDPLMMTSPERFKHVFKSKRAL